MELLLFWKAHYMDAWDAAKVASLTKNEKASYNARYQKGDIVEVRPDGYWDKRGFDKDSFCVVKVPGMAYDVEKMAALVDGDIILKRRKWKIDSTKLASGDKDSLDSASKSLSVTESTANTCLAEKAKP